MWYIAFKHTSCWAAFKTRKHLAEGSVAVSHSRLSLATHINVAGPHSPVAPAWHSGTQPAAFGDELLTGLPELADPPAVDDGVEHRLQVAEPQSADAHRVEDGAVIELPAEHGQQADHGVGEPTHGETHEEDEDGGESSGLEAHVHLDVRRPLQPGEPHLVDLVEGGQTGTLAGVVVYAQGVAAHRV